VQHTTGGLRHPVEGIDHVIGVEPVAVVEHNVFPENELERRVVDDLIVAC
jgi:hypothetical protein